MQKSLHSSQYAVFLEQLRHARLQAGVSQAELATRLRVEQSLISKCERGIRRLDVVELQLWVQALGLDLSSFVAELERRTHAVPRFRRS